MADKIKSAYRTSQKIYDAVLTQSTVFSRLYNKLFWGGTDDTEIARKMLACIPDDFRGTEQKEAESSSCGCGCSTRSADGTENKCRAESGGTENYRDEPNGEIRSITVLGAGCKSCRALYENAKEAAREHWGFPWKWNM